MSLIPSDIQNQVREAFQALDNPVKIILFTQGEGGAIECSIGRQECSRKESLRNCHFRRGLSTWSLWGCYCNKPASMRWSRSVWKTWCSIASINKNLDFNYAAG
jgi:hypothetical protein